MRGDYAFATQGNALDNSRDVASRVIADSKANARAFAATERLLEILRGEQTAPESGRILHRPELARVLRNLAIWVERNGALPRPVGGAGDDEGGFGIEDDEQGGVTR